MGNNPVVGLGSRNSTRICTGICRFRSLLCEYFRRVKYTGTIYTITFNDGSPVVFTHPATLVYPRQEHHACVWFHQLRHKSRFKWVPSIIITPFPLPSAPPIHNVSRHQPIVVPIYVSQRPQCGFYRKSRRYGLPEQYGDLCQYQQLWAMRYRPGSAPGAKVRYGKIRLEDRSRKQDGRWCLATLGGDYLMQNNDPSPWMSGTSPLPPDFV